MAGSVVVVVLVVDVVHVVVVDVGALQGLVALEVALTAPQNLGLTLGVDGDSLSLAASIELVGSWGVGVGLEGVAGGDKGVIAVGTWDLSDLLLDEVGSWEEGLSLDNADGKVVGGGVDHLTLSEQFGAAWVVDLLVANHLVAHGGELVDVADLSDGSNVLPVEVLAGWGGPA